MALKLKFENAEGVKYNIIFLKPHKRYNAWGLCDPPECKKPKIWIDPKLKPKRELEVLIEECFHAFCWEETEKKAGKFARELAKVIMETGWKKD